MSGQCRENGIRNRLGKSGSIGDLSQIRDGLALNRVIEV